MYPRRTRDGALALVATANSSKTKKAAKEVLGRQSIRNVSVSDTSFNQKAAVEDSQIIEYISGLLRLLYINL
jgi:hypothetical protein